MNRKPNVRSLGLFCAFALFVSCAFASPVLAQAHPSVADAAGKYTGPGSCASTSCHGSVLPRAENDVLQNEYSTWIVKDKHSKAYSALTGPVGEHIAGILNLGKAENAPRCLACHSLDPPAEQRSRSFDVSEGVSCESCHGPASGWLGPHTERGFTYEKSAALGMYDVRDLTKRTEKCLGCHVGSEEKYVDHEMIAAGHPLLQFELGSFSAVMPQHWKQTASPLDPERADPGYEVREMAVGQAVNLRESLQLLATRSRGKNWPEYSELQCEACHHSLTPPEQSWRQARGYPGRRPGDPPWNASRFTVFRDVAHQFDGADAAQLESSLTELAGLMSQLNPDREAVANASASAAHAANMLVEQMRAAKYDSDVSLALLRKISGDADEVSAQGEQSAAQAAMVLQSLLAAYERAQKPPNSKEGLPGPRQGEPGRSDVRAAITGLFDQLQNLSAYDPAKFAEQMRRVNALLR